jgi:glycosyltransferase involved in cell wall biosynthesis
VRVLKTVQSYFPFQERGGTAFKVRAIARGLARRGHHVTVLTADLGIQNHNSDGRFERSEWGWRFEDEGVETVYLSTLGRYRALTLNPGAMRFCAASLGRFDLVHIYGLYDLLGPAAAYFCRRKAVPYVLEPMGMYRPIVRNLALKKMYQRVIGAKLAAQARFVIATSEQERDELASAGIQADRIVIRRNGVDVPERLPQRGEFRREWSLPEGGSLILFLGRVVSKKRPDLLIRAFADWQKRSADRQNSFLVIAGPKEGDRYVHSLNSLARSLGVSERILFVGPLYGDDKWRAYRDADVFVLPSENENFGNTAAEAACCGTPVIVTDRCGIAPLIERAGLIVRPDCTEIASALEQILCDRAFNERCRKGCAEIPGSLSWSAPLDELEHMYQQCCSAFPSQQTVVTSAHFRERAS